MPKSRLWLVPSEPFPRLKVSRSSASSPGAAPPVEPPAGAYVWLDANELAGSAGAPVPSFPDRSGNNLPATDDGGTLDAPTLALDFDGNGNQGVAFNGTSELLGWVGGTLNFAGATGITVCGVVLPNAGAGVSLLSSFQTRDWGVAFDASKIGVYTTTSTFSNAVFPNAQLVAFELQQPRDGSDVPRFWKNGATSAGAGSSFLLSIEDAPLATTLCRYIGGGSFWGGTIGDLLIYKRQFDAADRLQWGAYIADKYGL